MHKICHVALYIFSADEVSLLKSHSRNHCSFHRRPVPGTALEVGRWECMQRAVSLGHRVTLDVGIGSIVQPGVLVVKRSAMIAM